MSANELDQPEKDKKDFSQPLISNKSQSETNAIKNSTLDLRSSINNLYLDPSMLRDTENLNLNHFEDNAAKTIEQVKESLSFFQQIPIFPLFDLDGLSDISKTYYFYFEIYLMLIKLAIAFLILGNIEYITLNLILDHYNLEYSEWWYSFVWGPVHLFNAFVIYKIRSQTEKKFTQDPRLFNLNWTEEHFSLVLHNLPLNTNVDDLRIYLEDLLGLEKGKSGVRYIVLLQNCNEYFKLKSKLDAINRRLKRMMMKDKEIRKSVDEKYNAEKLKINVRLHEIEEEAKENKYFFNQAIVVFNQVSFKVKVREHLKQNSTKETNLKGESSLKTEFFDNNNIFATDAKEPRDTLYHNLHFKSSDVMMRRIITYTFTIAIFVVGIFIMFWLRTRQYCIEAQIDNLQLDWNCNFISIQGSETWLEIQKFFGSIFTLILGTILEAFYTMINKYRIHYSKTESETSYIRYLIFINIMNSVIMFFIPLFLVGFEEMGDAIFQLFILYMIRRIVFKIWRIDFKKKKLREKLETFPDFKDQLSQEQILRAYQIDPFNFLYGIRDYLSMVYMMFGFFTFEAYAMVPIALLTLVGMAILDKYIILRHTSPFTLRTFEFGLIFMKPFHLDISIYFTVIALGYVKLYYYHHEYFEGFSTLFSLPYLSFYFFLGLAIFNFIYTEPKISSDIKRKFELTQSNVQYEDVSMVFETTYLQQYPFGGLATRTTLERRSFNG